MEKEEYLNKMRVLGKASGSRKQLVDFEKHKFCVWEVMIKVWLKQRAYVVSSEKRGRNRVLGKIRKRGGANV